MAMSYQSVNPSTGKIVKKFKEITNNQLETALKTSATCFETWRFKTFAERAVVVAKAAAILRARVDDFARPVTLEMGKLIADADGVEVTERSNAVRPDDAVMPSPLLDWLEQFYVPQPGAWFLKSFNEAVPAGLTNPFVGMPAPSTVTGAGSYVAGGDLSYQLLPYREDGNGRVYAGTILRPFIPGAIDSFGVVWPEWSAVPGWVTGFTVLIYSKATDYMHRDVSAATMFAGWTDDGSGWTTGVMPEFENPPRTLKLLWCQPDDGWTGEPVPVNLSASPLGGYGTIADRARGRDGWEIIYGRQL